MGATFGNMFWEQLGIPVEFPFLMSVSLSPVPIAQSVTFTMLQECIVMRKWVVHRKKRRQSWAWWQAGWQTSLWFCLEQALDRICCMFSEVHAVWRTAFGKMFMKHETEKGTLECYSVQKEHISFWALGFGVSPLPSLCIVPSVQRFSFPECLLCDWNRCEKGWNSTVHFSK